MVTKGRPGGTAKRRRRNADPGFAVTKLHIPQIRSRLVHRERLFARLEAGLECGFTLLCAPAGFGKTTLVVDWLNARPSEGVAAWDAAWCSLDEDDNDPARFLRFLVAALQVPVPRVGKDVVITIASSHPQALRASIAGLINEFAASRRKVILVFEDYHAIKNATVHEAVAFLIERRPASLGVVLVTREDPPLSFPRLRAGGGVCELRADDLRFTQPETAEFLRGATGAQISSDAAAAVAARTEGWIAGLQLAVLSMASEGVSEFIASLTGTHRHILDYLRTEVLTSLPPELVTFLLRTAVLDRLTGPLCDHVTDGKKPGHSQSLLEEVERRNLFLIPLDRERRWYRYHQLFADLLRVSLYDTEPALVPELHRRASRWFEEQGLVQPAVRHALAASDFDHVARLIERTGFQTMARGELQTVLGWFRALPTPVVEAHPSLSIIGAYALALLNQPVDAEAHLRNAEQHLELVHPAPDVAGFVRGQAMLLRGMMAMIPGDLERIAALAQGALSLLPAWDREGHAIARGFAGYAFRIHGDASPETERQVVDAVRHARAVDLPMLTRASLGLLARFYLVQGRLRQAESICVQAEHSLGLHVAQGAPIYCFSRGELFREWNDLDRAEIFLRQGIESVTPAAMIDAWAVADGYRSLARLRQARGDAGAATGVLDAFTVLARQGGIGAPVVAHMEAARAHLWLMQGNTTAAARWASMSGLGAHDPVSYLREPQYLTLVRAFIAQKNRAAVGLLDRLAADAQAGGRAGSLIEIVVLSALAWQSFGDQPRAFTALERALALGEREGYTRVFVDEGASMAALLRRARLRGIAPEYTGRLLAAFGERRPAVPFDASGTAGDSNPAGADGFIEPLTSRERDILRYITMGASNGDIARELIITTGTVKRHVYHIFGKLGVKSRTQAIVKARSLNLG